MHKPGFLYLGDEKDVLIKKIVIKTKDFITITSETEMQLNSAQPASSCRQNDYQSLCCHFLIFLTDYINCL